MIAFRLVQFVVFYAIDCSFDGAQHGSHITSVEFEGRRAPL